MTLNAAQLAERLRHPAPRHRMVALYALALFGNLLPWSGLPWLPGPDFLALALLFFSVYQPDSVPLAAPFCLGLLMDVADGNALGTHAIAYVALSACAQGLSLRITQFGAAAQTAHVLALFLALRLCELLVGGLTGEAHLTVQFWLMVPMMAALWPLLLLAAARRLRREYGGNW